MKNHILTPPSELSIETPKRMDDATLSRRQALRYSMASLALLGCAHESDQKIENQDMPTFDPLRDALETKEKIVQLPVPFVCQAPTGNWKPPFDEACEETCLLMLQMYLQGAQEIDTKQAEEDIRMIADLVAKKGHGIDIGVKTVAELAKERYALQTKVYEGNLVTAENIKRLVAARHPIIVPVAQFKNEFYKSELPYHMVIIRGFQPGNEDDMFTTNDPGTRRGGGYAYRAKYLMEHIHEWDGNRATVPKAPKAMLVMRKGEK